ncbi:MAG: hypothetical protein ACFFB3_03430 [Candidatus Hodarchaeota archaeon]
MVLSRGQFLALLALTTLFATKSLALLPMTPPQAIRSMDIDDQELSVQYEGIRNPIKEKDQESVNPNLVSLRGKATYGFDQEEKEAHGPYDCPNQLSQDHVPRKLLNKISSALEDVSLNSDKVTALATDSSDNIIAAGNVEDDMLGVYGGAYWDAFISKFSPDGEWDWSIKVEGRRFDVINDIAIDSEDNIIVLGTTDSDDLQMENGYDSIYNGGTTSNPWSENRDVTIVGDLFLIKYSPFGTVLWSTYLGGAVEDRGLSVTIDSQQNIIITGLAKSVYDFPTTPGPFNTSVDTQFSDLVASKFDPSGTLLWSAFLGGSGPEETTGTLPNLGMKNVATDQQDSIIIAATTKSDDYPTTANAYDDSLNGSTDAVISKFNASGALVWSTYLGGTNWELGLSSTIDSQNNIIIGGQTYSDDFPITPNAYDSTFAGSGDVFVSKFNSTGNLLWSTYLGGEKEEESFSLLAGSQSELVVAGYTKSTFFPTLYAYDSSLGGGWDVFVSIFDINGEMLWSTYLGGTEDDLGSVVTVDTQNNLLLGGYTDYADSSDFPLEGNSFRFSFGGLTDGFISKFNTSKDLIWSIRAPIITEATADPDGDGLTNSQEFAENLDPLNNDTDRDGMADGWEVTYSPPLSPLWNDSRVDHDLDGLTNLQEFQYGLSPLESDTDNDTMPDAWEVLMGLNGSDSSDAAADKDQDGLSNLQEYTLGLNATNADTDGDMLPDGWEDKYGLNGTISNAENDTDKDGLTNLEEYQRHLDPTDEDTDHDGMPDGWEVRYSLNPRRNDAQEDADGDLIPNGLEYSLNFDPQDPRETLIGIFMLIIGASLLSGLYLRRRHLQRTALALGFENAAALKKARKAGFASAQAQKEVHALGFLTAASYELATAAGFSTAQRLVDSWQSAPPTFQAKIPDEEIQGALRTIQDTTSPTELAHVEGELASLQARISRAQDQLTQNLALQRDMATLFRKMKLAQIVPVDEAQLHSYQEKTSVILQLFQQYETDIQTVLRERREWFAPWPRLLTLIQVTEDRMPIALNRIAEIVGCDEPRAEMFLIALLQEDESIGEYDATRQMFTKGRDLVTVLDRYLQRVRQELGDIMTSTRE